MNLNDAVNERVNYELLIKCFKIVGIKKCII